LTTLLVATLYARAGHRQQVIALAHDVKAGQVIERSDLRAVGIASDSSIKTVALASAPSIIGKAANTNLTAGSVLSPDSVNAAAPLPEGQAIVGASMKPGQYPTGLRTGDRVLVVTTESQSAQSVTAPDSITATVTDIGAATEATGQSTVSLQLDVADAPAVANAAASNNLALVILGQ
jgi:hypothetical protein